MYALIGLGIGLAIVIAVVLFSDRFGPAPRTAGPLEPPRPEASRHALRAQVLFAERYGKMLQIDCVLLESVAGRDHQIPGGTPIVLRLQPPSTALVGVSIESVLRRWADESRVIELRFIDEPPGRRVRLSSDRSKLRLELEETIGIG